MKSIEDCCKNSIFKIKIDSKSQNEWKIEIEYPGWNKICELHRSIGKFIMVRAFVKWKVHTELNWMLLQIKWSWNKKERKLKKKWK